MRKKSVLPMLLLTILLFGTAIPVKGEGTNENILEARENVVRTFNATEGTIGSGFAVGKKGEDPQYFVTNDHCVSGAGRGAQIYLVLESLEEESSVLPVEVVYYTDEKGADIAVLKTQEPVPERKPSVLGAAEETRETDTVYALGYPGDTDLFTESQGTLESSIEDCTIKTGHITRMKGGEYRGARFMVFEGQIKPGNSGGPLMNEDAEVIGVNSISLNVEDAVDNGAIYIEEVKAVLDELGIDYQENASSGTVVKKTGQGLRSLSKVVLPVSMVLLVIVLIAVVWKKRKRDKSKGEEAWAEEDFLSEIEMDVYEKTDSDIESGDRDTKYF